MKKLLLSLICLLLCACQSQNKKQNDIQNKTQETSQREMPTYEKAFNDCYKGVKNACDTALFLSYQNDLKDENDLKILLDLAKKGCEQKENYSCMLYSQAHFFGIFVEKNNEKGIELLKRGCEGGGVNSCNDLSYIYFFGLFGQKADGTKSKSYLDEVCTNHKEACRTTQTTLKSYEELKKLKQNNSNVFFANLWDEYFTKIKTKNENVKNIKIPNQNEPKNELKNEFFDNSLVAKMDEAILLKKSCALNDLKSCYELGKKYEYGTLLRQSYAKAFEHYVKSQNYEPSKQKIAFFLHFGLGTKQDFNGAYQIYKSLCDTGNKSACESSAFLEKIVIQKAPFDTLLFLEKKCDEKKGEFCYILNKYLLFKKDLKKGWEIALKACLNGFNYACGVGFNELKMSQKEKFELSQKRCEEGSAVFCQKVAEFYEYGIEGARRDYEKSVEFSKKACALGEVNACISVALKYSNAYYSDKGDKDEFIKKIESAILIQSKVCELGKAFKEQDLDYVCGFVESSKNSKNQALNPKPKEKWIPPFTPLPKDEQIPLDKAPNDEVANALIYYRQLAGIGENLICDDENSKECKAHLESECKDAGTKDDKKRCKEMSLSWNSSFSGRHARYATTYIMTYLRDISAPNYDKNSFLYFLKYTKNLGIKAMDILAGSAGDDAGSDNEAPFIAWLIKNNSINQIKDIKEVFGAQNSAELKKLFGENNATSEMKELLLK